MCLRPQSWEIYYQHLIKTSVFLELIYKQQVQVKTSAGPDKMLLSFLPLMARHSVKEIKKLIWAWQSQFGFQEESSEHSWDLAMTKPKCASWSGKWTTHHKPDCSRERGKILNVMYTYTRRMQHINCLPLVICSFLFSWMCQDSSWWVRLGQTYFTFPMS